MVVDIVTIICYNLNKIKLKSKFNKKVKIVENIKFEFVIDEEKNLAYVVKHGKTFKDYENNSLGSVLCVFGDLLSELENVFEPPDYKKETLSEYIINHFISDNHSSKDRLKQQAIYGFPVSWSVLVPIHTF